MKLQKLIDWQLFQTIMPLIKNEKINILLFKLDLSKNG